MRKYIIKLTDLAKEQLQKHKKSGNKANLNKISNFFHDLEINSYEGVGNPKQLKHSSSGFWSRLTNQRDRIIYSVSANLVLVEIVSAMRHYSDI